MRKEGRKEWMKELRKELRKERKEGEETNIKSNIPHLTGGRNICFLTLFFSIWLHSKVWFLYIGSFCEMFFVVTRDRVDIIKCKTQNSYSFPSSAILKNSKVHDVGCFFVFSCNLQTLKPLNLVISWRASVLPPCIEKMPILFSVFVSSPMFIRALRQVSRPPFPLVPLLTSKCCCIFVSGCLSSASFRQINVGSSHNFVTWNGFLFEHFWKTIFESISLNLISFLPWCYDFGILYQFVSALSSSLSGATLRFQQKKQCNSVPQVLPAATYMFWHTVCIVLFSFLKWHWTPLRTNFNFKFFLRTCSQIGQLKVTREEFATVQVLHHHSTQHLQVLFFFWSLVCFFFSVSNFLNALYFQLH